MPNTTNESLPYPAGTVGVPPDVRGDIQSLATAADGKIHEVRGIANVGGADTGWSLSKLTLQTGWDTKTDPSGNTSGTLTGGIRKIGIEARLKVRANRNGSTISADSSGNFADNPVYVINDSSYRPSSPEYIRWVKPGLAGGDARIDPNGTISLTNFSSGGSTLPNNSVIQIYGSWPVG